MKTENQTLQQLLSERVTVFANGDRPQGEVMTWTKQPPIEAHYGGCLNCGPRPALFPPEGVIAVGFGYAALHKDGEAVWTEGETVADNSMMTGAQAEALAAADPDHDWRIVIHGPLSGRTYQRHGPGQWMLVEKNEGFA